MSLVIDAGGFCQHECGENVSWTDVCRCDRPVSGFRLKHSEGVNLLGFGRSYETKLSDANEYGPGGLWASQQRLLFLQRRV